MRFLEDGSKVRYSKKGQVVIPKPTPKRGWKPSNTVKDTTSTNVLDKTFTEQEMIELKNKYLRQMELAYYNHLKQKYENEQKDQVKKTLYQRRFQYEVYQRAKQLYADKFVAKQE